MLPCFGLSALRPDPARRPGIIPCTAVHKACPYMDGVVGSILNEDALPPPPSFSCLGMLLIFGLYDKCNNFVLIHYEDGSIYLGLLLMTGWLHGNNSRPHYCVLYCHLNNISTFLSVTAVLWYVGGKRCQKVWSIEWPCIPVSIS